MSQPTQTQTKFPTRDGRKKTKSRNGCGRCKLKRLKCDETTPGCFQCQKRNVACPGYEKALKWSTKYELLQPIQFNPTGTSPPRTRRKPKATQEPLFVDDVTLTPEVVNGFEALAKVLPINTKSKPSTSPVTAPEEDKEVEERNKSQSPPFQKNTIVPREDTQAPDFNQDIPIDVIDPDISDIFFHEGISLTPEPFDFDPLEFVDINLPIDLDPPPDLDEDVEEVERTFDDTSSITSDISDSRLSRSLLLDYYRLSAPSPSSTSLSDTPSMLIQHYFQDVCVLFSSFDSALNPWRMTIGRLFQNSPCVYYGIQSMAAAHLANTFPLMTKTGIELQSKASSYLQEDLQLVSSGQGNIPRTLLSLILLGITTAWHESSALGLDYLATARSLMLTNMLNSSEDDEAQRQNEFFEEAMIYWEMLMGFVSHDSMSFSATTSRPRASFAKPSRARKKDGFIVPHPWTGVAPRIQMLFAEVGRILRKERMMIVGGIVDLHRTEENIDLAESLEADLLAGTYPLEDELADPMDKMTSKRDLLVIAECYRCTGLLEIYRVFPSVLQKRLNKGPDSLSAIFELSVPIPRYGTPYEDTDTKTWLNGLAMHILSALESLPSSSGTCCTQPILLCAAASELRFVSSIDFFDLHANDAKILHTRHFAGTRLREYALRLPGKPINRILEIIEEVWRELDQGMDVFWIDIMIEKGWHTVMG